MTTFNIKTRLFGAALALCAADGASAIPAYPYPIRVRQPDGSFTTIIKTGDEWQHATYQWDERLQMRGRMIGNAGGLGDWSFSGLGKVTSPNAQTTKRPNNQTTKRPSPKRPNDQTTKRPNNQAPIRRIRINNFPTTGEPPVLVLLIEFSDRGFTAVDDAHDFYTRMLNEPGFTYTNGANGSAYDFYHDNSNGLFRPRFEVVGPIRLNKTVAYYGTGDNRAAEALRDACLQVDDEVDFSRYDMDGDGMVDNIYFFYAGYGEADSPYQNTIWPHSFTLRQAGFDLQMDGVTVNRYACSNELRYDASGELIPTGIGTFVHEFAHVLGLPDLYDTANSSSNNGPYTWDTMAAGPYNNQMNTPPAFSAYERAELGWLEYTDLSGSTDTTTVVPDLQASNRAYRVPVYGRPEEFFVLENRQLTGWDSYLPGHGMLAWHIHHDEKAWQDNAVNNEAGHNRVDMVEADGTQSRTSLAGDAYPGTGGVTECRLTTFQGDDIMTLVDIEEDGDIRFRVMGEGYTVEPPTGLSVTWVQDSSFCIRWEPSATAQFYLLTVRQYGPDGTRSIVADLDNKLYRNAETVVVEGLEPATLYEITVRAGKGSSLSDAISETVRTQNVPFHKRQPKLVSVVDATPTGLTVEWQPVEDADDYRATLYTLSYGEATHSLGCDFTGKQEGMPPLWHTTGASFYSVKGWYGQASPSLRLQAGGELTIAFEEAKIGRLSFWCRAKKDGQQLDITIVDGERREQLTVAVPTEGAVVEVDAWDAESVTLRLPDGDSFVVIDDVVALCSVLERIAVRGYDGVSTQGECRLSMGSDGGSSSAPLLSQQTEYAFRVCAVQGNEQSRLSEELRVVTPPSDGATGIENIEHSSLNMDRSTLTIDHSSLNIDRSTLNTGRFTPGGIRVGKYYRGITKIRR